MYLGYALGQYSEFYKIDHVMILGRVSKGAGGDLMLSVAKKVLETEFPEFAGMQFHTADDHFKAVGQCIAAAALPLTLERRESLKNIPISWRAQPSSPGLFPCPSSPSQALEQAKPKPNPSPCEISVR